MRSFRTLMMEGKPQRPYRDAVADRLCLPLILATLGLPTWVTVSRGFPALPISMTCDDLQAALAADFKLMVPNLGLSTECFGRNPFLALTRTINE